MSFRLACLIAAATLLAGAANANASVVFDFTGVSGAGNPVTIPVGTNTATFDSPSGPNTFVVGPTGVFGFHAGLNDIGYNPITLAGDTLTITFANPLTDSIVMPFGILDAFGLAGNDVLTITPDIGPVITATTTLDSFGLQNPEGTVVINDPGATQLTITSANPFSIASAPEPVSMSILGAGLAGLAFARRRRA